MEHCPYPSHQMISSLKLTTDKSIQEYRNKQDYRERSSWVSLNYSESLHKKEEKTIADVTLPEITRKKAFNIRRQTKSLDTRTKRSSSRPLTQKLQQPLPDIRRPSLSVGYERKKYQNRSRPRVNSTAQKQNANPLFQNKYQKQPKRDQVQFEFDTTLNEILIIKQVLPQQNVVRNRLYLKYQMKRRPPAIHFIDELRS